MLSLPPRTLFTPVSSLSNVTFYICYIYFICHCHQKKKKTKKHLPGHMPLLRMYSYIKFFPCQSYKLIIISMTVLLISILIMKFQASWKSGQCLYLPLHLTSNTMPGYKQNLKYICCIKEWMNTNWSYTSCITKMTLLKDANNLLLNLTDILKLHMRFFCHCFLKNVLSLLSKTMNVLNFCVYSSSEPLPVSSFFVHYLNVNDLLFSWFSVLWENIN